MCQIEVLLVCVSVLLMYTDCTVSAQREPIHDSRKYFIGPLGVQDELPKYGSRYRWRGAIRRDLSFLAPSVRKTRMQKEKSVEPLRERFIPMPAAPRPTC